MSSNFNDNPRTIGLSELGRMIHEARKKKDWSLRELAEQCDTSAMAISLIERGERKPRIELCAKLANVLKLSKLKLFALAYPQIPASFTIQYDQGNESVRCEKKLFNLIMYIKRLPEDKQAQLIPLIEGIVKAMEPNLQHEDV